MLLNDKPLVDPKSIYTYYMKNGLSLELLNKCNLQEFKYIDGYGLGYWLYTSDMSFPGATVELKLDTLSVTLAVLNDIALEIPTFVSTHLKVLVTAEPKYLLNAFTVTKNYNVITSIDEDAGTYKVEGTERTLEEIIEDILYDSGYLLDFAAPPLAVTNVFLQGLSVFEAIDKICSVYGLGWTVTYAAAPSTDKTVYINKAFNGPAIPLTEITDVRDPDQLVYFNAVNISYDKKTAQCDEGNNEYYTKEWTDVQPGSSLNIYDPYFPAIYKDTTLKNAAAINARSATIKTNMQAVGKLSTSYIVKAEDNPLAFTPINCFNRIHCDLGVGSRSIFLSKPYPFFKVLEPTDSCSGDTSIEYIIDSIATKATGPYTGLEAAQVTVKLTSKGLEGLIGTTQEVIDHSGCIFDAVLTGVWGWATTRVALSTEAGAAVGTFTPPHWSTDNRCCP